jgi:molybdopterin/thiamine biosynthesis adenylyltransferase/rhodanese-related sulfurtransferase
VDHASGSLVVLDVRTAEERAQGYIPGSLHLDRSYLEARIETLVPDRSARIVCCCESGVRSLFAAQTLKILGYHRVSSLNGGMREWKVSGQPLTMHESLSQEQRRRYLRHLTIPEVGEEGQAKLLAAKVLIVGAGGLGCPAALYLAAAGVGTLGIVDGDIVDASNLQRQVLHKHGTVGQLKTNSAKEALLALNPDIDVRTYCRRLDRAGALELFKDYDIIVDGCDNFSTRYLINDVSVHHGKPVVHGSVYRFEGQVSVFKSAEGPCYRCLYPEAPPPELAPSCADAGVLGVLPGVIGLLQATEVIKLILVLGSGLIGRALRYDALAGRFRELRFAKNPTCPCCGPAAGPVSLTDEVQLACSVG